ncbi:MAG: hypothetical protein GXY36_15135 [Chloroflexi bacterium]|nr:hypothetical protein [Chloroflexota bacterium]
MIRHRRPMPDTPRRISISRAAGMGLLGLFVIFLLWLAVTGSPWRAIAYAVVALGALLVALASYFWGALVLGSSLEALFRRSRTPVPWSFEQEGDDTEHDIDPGLELMAAGILVYRVGETRPEICFREIPLAGVRAIRPFIVARTGMPRDYPFDFALLDEHERRRFDAAFDHGLRNAPVLVAPARRLALRAPGRLLGRRWNLLVRSGVTVVTAVSFRFVDEDGSGEYTSLDRETALRLSWQMLPHLLDEALQQDAVSPVPEVVLED